jgi:CubicO group peptidase (beta-lactamase class C family)
MKSIIGAGLILAAMMQPALAQTKLETFKAEAQAALEDQNIAGAALALVGPEGPIGQMCFGLADKDKGNRINGATAFTLGSTSKIFIGVALAQAVEKGQISLDQPIAHFLDFEIGSKNAHRITFKDLARHRSGIIDRPDHYFSTATYHQGADHPTSLGQYLKDYLAQNGKHFDQRANFAAYGEYNYSNIGSALAAYALEKATGTPFDAQVRSQILTPLGMDHTFWHLSDYQAGGLARPYYDVPLDGFAPNAFYSLASWPDGGLRSSITDLSKFMAMLMNEGELNGNRIISKEGFQPLYADLLAGDQKGYGLFFEKFRLKGPLPERTTFWGHTGGDPGAVSFAVFNKDMQRGVILLMNAEPDDEAINQFFAFTFNLFSLEQDLRSTPSTCE